MFYLCDTHSKLSFFVFLFLCALCKEKNGCCGEKELVKLEAYTLTDHPVVVHMDLDVVVLKPMDALFDVMLDSTTDRDTSKVPIMWPDLPLPEKVNAFFTRDCKLMGRNDVAYVFSLDAVLTSCFQL